LRFVYLCRLRFLKQILDFYINASLHVSLATAALVAMTYYFFDMPANNIVLLFVFFGTLVSYNTIKYGSYVLNHVIYKQALKIIVFLTFVSAIACVYLFFELNFNAQLVTLFFVCLSFLYLIPIGKKQKNLRNFAGIKIYIVSFCWAGVTILIPLFNADLPVESDLFFKFSQRFVLTLMLILIFEIKDLKQDDIQLKTVPQSIGVSKTKYIIYSLLFVFYFLEFFKKNVYVNQWIVNLILVALIFLFTIFASPKKSKYYTLLWVEAIPILWFLLVLIF